MVDQQVEIDNRYRFKGHKYLIGDFKEFFHSHGVGSWNDVTEANDEGFYIHKSYIDKDSNPVECKVFEVSFGDANKSIKLKWDQFRSLGKPKFILEKIVIEAVE